MGKGDTRESLPFFRDLQSALPSFTPPSLPPSFPSYSFVGDGSRKRGAKFSPATFGRVVSIPLDFLGDTFSHHNGRILMKVPGNGRDFSLLGRRALL